MSAPPAARTPPDEGATLVELLVAMVLTAVVLGGAGAVFTATTRGVHDVTARTSAQADVRTAVQAMTRTLRVAVQPPGTDGAIVAMSPASITFYASLQRTAVATATASGAAGATRAVLQPPTLVSYGLDTTRGCLVESQTPAVATAGAAAATTPWSWPASGTTTKCLAATTTAPALTYFPSGVIVAGSPPVTTAPLAVPAAGSTDPALRASVQSVRVVVAVPDPASPTALLARDAERVTLVNTTGGS